MNSGTDKSIEEKKKLQLTEKIILQKMDDWKLGDKNREIIKRALKVESLGHLGFSAPFEAPLVIEQAEEGGALVYDADGKEYIDMIAGYAVSNIGHHRSEVLEAITGQFNKITQYCEMMNETRIRLSEKLVTLTPGNFRKKVYYGITGGDAVEIAVKIVRYYTGKAIILTQLGDYHGRTYGAAAYTHTPSTWAQMIPVPPYDCAVVRFPFAYCYRCPFGKEYPDCETFCVNTYLRSLLDVRQYHLRDSTVDYSNVAALLIEPFQGASGGIIPPDEYLPALQKVASDYDILLIDDEIMSGWARSGKMWAVQNYKKVNPDILLTSKSIANGLPFSAVIGREEVIDSLGSGGHSATFTGYPLGAAAALKTIEIIEREQLDNQAMKKGNYFMTALRDLKQESRILGDVNGKGLFIGLELIRDQKTKRPADKETSYIQMRLVQEGMLVRATGYFGNRLHFMPPLTITYEQIDHSINVLDQVLRETEKKFL